MPKMTQILPLSHIALYLGMQVDTQLSFKEFIEYYCVWCTRLEIDENNKNKNKNPTAFPCKNHGIY